MKRGIVGFVVLALAVVAGPAEADTSHGSVTGVSAVLFNDCLSYPYRWSVDVPDTSGYRALRTSLVGPDGAVADTGYVVPDANVSSGTSSFVLCPADGYGTYTIHADVAWGPDAETLGEPSPLEPATFTMRKPFTTTSVRASTRRPSYRQLVTYRISSFDERPTGYAPNGLAWVHLEKKARGQWVRMRGGRAMTHSTGRVKVRLRYLRHHHKPVRIRAVTEPTGRYALSTSPMLRLW